MSAPDPLRRKIAKAIADAYGCIEECEVEEFYFEADAVLELVRAEIARGRMEKAHG